MSPRTYVKKPISDRFWSKIDVKTEDECWEYLEYRDKEGYGQFWKDGTNHRAHRIAYEFKHGPISDDILVCHTCDNPPCCNPKHLFLGNHLENVQDCIQKGRKGINHDGGAPLGERNGSAKLDKDKVLHAKELRQKGWTFRKLAEMYGVTTSAIRNAIIGKTWSHIEY